MVLALSLPTLEARPANPPETRPARVQPWLEETLKREPIDAAGIIGDALAATNRVAVSEPRRLELAERYYGTALTLWPNLERHFARAQHPLSGNALAAAKASLTLATELATAYKHLLAHEAEKRILLSGNRLLVALIHRCLQCTLTHPGQQLPGVRPGAAANLARCPRDLSFRAPAQPANDADRERQCGGNAGTTLRAVAVARAGQSLRFHAGATRRR